MHKTLDTRKPVVGNTDYPTKINGLIDDVKNAVNLPGLPFSFKEDTTAGLTLGLFGGQMAVNGALTTIADTTIALTGSDTNYVEYDAAGAVSKNTTGWSAGKYPIAEVVTDAGSVTGYTDRRNANSMLMPGRVSIDVAGGAGTTELTAAQWANDVLEFTGVLTGNRVIEVPETVSRPKVVFNATTGAFTLTLKTAGGSGVAVSQSKRGVVYCDGTNVELAFSDPSGVGGVAPGAITTSGLTMATGRGLGRVSGGSGAIEELTPAQITANLVEAASDTAAGKIEIAVQSEMEAASSNALAVPPGRMKYHPGVVKAWAKHGISGNLLAGLGIGSVTDTGPGQSAITLSVAMSSAHYFNSCTVDTSASSIVGYIGDFVSTATTYLCNGRNSASGALTDPNYYSSSVLGDL